MFKIQQNQCSILTEVLLPILKQEQTIKILIVFKFIKIGKIDTCTKRICEINSDKYDRLFVLEMVNKTLLFTAEENENIENLKILF